jgi:hypothetical protein
MLHAARLKLNHPVTGAAMDLVAPIPSDFREQIDQLRVLFPTRR